jgi:hypothetical protein
VVDPTINNSLYLPKIVICCLNHIVVAKNIGLLRERSLAQLVGFPVVEPAHPGSSPRLARGAHKGRVCMRAFIGVNVRACL